MNAIIFRAAEPRRGHTGIFVFDWLRVESIRQDETANNISNPRSRLFLNAGGANRNAACQLLAVFSSFESMRREAEFFGDRELGLLFMARRLREALRLEELLTSSGVEYCVETGDYVGGFLFKRELTGAFFYVDPDALGALRQLLAANQFKPYDSRRDR